MFIIDKFYSVDEGLMSSIDLEETVANISYAETNGEMRNKIQILLVTANEIEYNAVLASLSPLDGPSSPLLKYHHIYNVGKKFFNAQYIFGKFGSFNAAVHRMTRQGPAPAQDVVTVAASCFHNLNVIFAVGVACGAGKAKMLDVVVSQNISVYTAARISTAAGDDDWKIENRGVFNMPVSSFLCTYFVQPPKWPIANSIATKLSKKPELRLGNILSGNYLVDNKRFKEKLLNEFAYNGIEMEGAGLFYDYQDNKYQIMIVKGICDFGDGKKDKKYQPTAAMLAVECLKHCFSSP